VLTAAVVLAAALLLLVGVLPARLAAARWPLRAPVLALALWQAAGLAGGLLLLELTATVALAPLGADDLTAVRRIPSGHLPWWSWLAAGLGVAVLLRLLSVLVASTLRTVQARRRNRVLVDLVGSRNLLLRGAHVVDHELPVAYCLPGLRPRVVMSKGVLALLSYEEVQAVLAHEQAHLVQRHDLVVLPFVALGSTFPALTAVRTARGAVSLLIEVLADDQAARRHDRGCLARALWKIGTAAAPIGALGAGGGQTLVRARRLLNPPEPLAAGSTGALGLLVAVVALSPLAAVLVPLALR